MNIRIAFLIIFLTMGTQVAASPFDGAWSTRGSSLFSLELVQNGNLVCGQVTAISGEKVDASWVIGVIMANSASVEFSSGFAEKGARGTALIESKGGKFKWRVMQQINQSWIWSEALMTRESFQPDRKLLVESWCKKYWSSMTKEDSASINLLP